MTRQPQPQPSDRACFYSALWWHFGPYGPQDVHVHSCVNHEGCAEVLIGSGRQCDGTREGHWRANLDEASVESRAVATTGNEPS